MIGLGFTSAIYLVDEEEGFVEVCLELRGSLERNVLVTLATSNGTALGMYCMCAKSFLYHLADSYSCTFCYVRIIIRNCFIGSKGCAKCMPSCGICKIIVTSVIELMTKFCYDYV